jgi:hypothetical protein
VIGQRTPSGTAEHDVAEMVATTANAISTGLQPAGDSGRIAAPLQRQGVHDAGYFGPGTFEQFSIPDTG